MKNFKCLSTFEERKEFISNIWESKEFIGFSNSPEMKQIYHDFCKYPRFVAEYSNQKIEHAHFYSWFNILIKRDYENKIVQDLYYLHELKHITTLTYDPTLNFNDWKTKMIQNELESALFSEVQIYDLIPNLRKKSFDYPIWFDEIPELIRKNEDFLKSYRKQVMKNPKTEVSKTLYRYQLSNDSWSEVWRVNYSTVEKIMLNFYEQCLVNKDRAIKDFILNFKIDIKSDDQIIFNKEALQFTNSYLKLKKETGT